MMTLEGGQGAGHLEALGSWVLTGTGKDPEVMVNLAGVRMLQGGSELCPAIAPIYRCLKP
jgi:hypothetical protein